MTLSFQMKDWKIHFHYRAILRALTEKGRAMIAHSSELATSEILPWEAIQICFRKLNNFKAANSIIINLKSLKKFQKFL